MSAPIFHDEPPDVPLAELGRYPHVAEAREHGLVVASMDLPYWIARQGREYVLCVREPDRNRAAAALADFVREEQARPAPIPVEPLRIPRWAVVMALIGMAACYAAQRALPAWVTERGVADDLLIRGGQWWRAFTALTLHANLEHLVSNFSLAIFVFAFVFARFGTSAGILAIVLGGGLGNVLNVFFHVAEAHRSLGSSTALFAGLGLLTGVEMASRRKYGASRAGWQWMVPIGAGFAFLSLFGGGGGQNRDGTPAPLGNVDLLAHLFGLLAGFAVGRLFFVIGLKRRAGTRVQILAGVGAGMGMVVVWWKAIAS